MYYPGDHADGAAAGAGPRSPAARGGRGPAAEEDEEVGVEEGHGPEDGHAPELRRADHAERLAVHGGRGRFTVAWNQSTSSPGEVVECLRNWMLSGLHSNYDSIV